MIFIRNGNTWQHQQTITASDGKSSDAFGFSVSFKGNQLLVGAMHANVGSQQHQGKAYMFRYINNSWQEEAIFTNSDGANGGGSFGWAVATDGLDAAVSANNVTFMGNPAHGRIYLFRR